MKSTIKYAMDDIKSPIMKINIVSRKVVLNEVSTNFICKLSEGTLIKPIIEIKSVIVKCYLNSL